MDFFPVQDENDPHATNLLNAFGTVEYRVDTDTEKDTEFWTLSKPLLDRESEYQLIAVVEHSKWGAPTVIRSQLLGGKADTKEKGKGMPLSLWLKKRNYGFTWSM
jgi:hypothetical protein